MPSASSLSLLQPSALQNSWREAQMLLSPSKTFLASFLTEEILLHWEPDEEKIGAFYAPVRDGHRQWGSKNVLTK